MSSPASTSPMLDATVELAAGTYRLGEAAAERDARLGGVRIARCPVVNASFARSPGCRVRRRPWRVGLDEREQARAARALGDRQAGVDAAGHGRAGSLSASKVNRDSTGAWARDDRCAS
jgi:hypothetical protein